MRKALLIVSWVAVVLGGIALIGAFTADYYDEDVFYEFVGGGLFLAQGLLAINYVKEKDREAEIKKSGE